MKKPVFIILLLIPLGLLSQTAGQFTPNPVRNIFMQGNNINTVFRTDGIFNYDKITFSYGAAGFIWPVSSTTRKTINFASGLWIAAKVGPQRDLRTAACFYSTMYTPGNIPVIGQVPPQSVCNDSTWRGYLVNTTEQSLVNGGTRTKIAGGRSYTITYDSLANWPISKGALFVEVNGVPGYQPGWNADRPGIGNSTSRPDELCYMVYMDYTNCTNNLHQSEIDLPGNTLPMGAEIHQLSFMFNCSSLQNMYFVKWILFNKSNLTWDSTYISLANDPDDGDAADDAIGSDSARDMGIVYNADNSDWVYGANPPCIGTRFLQSPLRFTGNPNDTLRLPYKVLVGYKLIGMTGNVPLMGTANPCFSDPDNAIIAYNYMKGLNGCGVPYINHVTHQPTKFYYSGDACNRLGWIDSFSHDTRYLQSSGPFAMNPGDTQTIVMAFIIGSGSNNFQNVCNLQSLSDSAYKYYYNDFPVCFPIGIQPISTEVPQHFALYQNYPNPFNPATKIRFSVPVVGDAYMRPLRIVVYDALGREVIVLVNESLAPGTYETDFDASNLPSGVYFYKLSAGEFTESKKMILLK